MYNPDAENMYKQEPQRNQPVSEQYNQPYPYYPHYPAYSTNSASPFPAENKYPAQDEKIHPQSPRRKEGSVAHTTKVQALAIVKTCKKWLIIGSVVCFGVFSGLAVTHTTGVTSQAATNNATQQQQQTAPTYPGQGGFFQQQPQQQQGGNNFGNGDSSQSPVSGSGVS